MSKNAKVIYNGELLDADSGSSLLYNRGFLYGDGFFESMRFERNKILRFDLHYKRILENMQLLKMESENFPYASALEKMILDLTQANSIANYSRVRLNIFRESSGAYTPDENKASYFISCTALDSALAFPVNGLHIGIYDLQKKAAGPFSGVKSLSSQFYVMAGIYAKENGWEEVLVMNTEGKFIEALSSNIFYVKNNMLCTPPISDGCVNGVFRKYILSVLDKNGIECKEESFYPDDISQVSEIFMCNAIKGIQWVEILDGKKFGNEMARRVFDLIVK